MGRELHSADRFGFVLTTRDRTSPTLSTKPYLVK
jgi:hypothetical protein